MAYDMLPFNYPDQNKEFYQFIEGGDWWFETT